MPRGGGQGAGVAALMLWCFSGSTQSGHAGAVGAAGAGARHERTNGNGHWALGIHTEPRRPSMGIWEGEGEGARASRSAAAGLFLCRIRRADQEVLRISSPYWRLVLPVKGPPHLCRLPLQWYATVCPQQGGRTHFLRCICTILVSLLREVMGWCRRAVRHKCAPSWAEQSERTPRLGPIEKANCPVPAAQVDTGCDGAGQWAMARIGTERYMR